MSAAAAEMTRGPLEGDTINSTAVPYGEDIGQAVSREFEIGAVACIPMTASNNDDCILDEENYTVPDGYLDSITRLN